MSRVLNLGTEKPEPVRHKEIIPDTPPKDDVFVLREKCLPGNVPTEVPTSKSPQKPSTDPEEPPAKVRKGVKLSEEVAVVQADGEVEKSEMKQEDGGTKIARKKPQGKLFKAKPLEYPDEEDSNCKQQ